ncbi:mevalonate kinase [Nitrosopumilus sp.]|uniref:mevalonate kinase n=1 Tax=Nitrosopumilus sp. TaxID=2024843 RepID=UPI00261D04C0|nr:mevalonate kinase [Nitrosopumilus sp.]
MKSKSSAPGKVILFGEHFVVHGIKAVLCAINKRVFVTAEAIDEEKISIKSNIGDLELDKNKNIDEINSPLKPFYFLADKLLKEQSEIEGIKISIKSEIPLGVGLGSSSACCVAGAGAISGLFSEKTKDEILELAIDAEKTIFKNTSGADCTVSTHGGIMVYDKTGFTKIESEPNFQLVISNSNIEHSTEKVVAEVQKFKDKNETEFAELCSKESELIESVLRIFKKNEIKELGEKVIENQKFLEIIGISNDTLREMVKVGNKTSFGSKITGAGGGGCIFSLANEENAEETLKEFKNKNYECFSVKIDFKGLDTF